MLKRDHSRVGFGTSSEKSEESGDTREDQNKEGDALDSGQEAQATATQEKQPG
jgi:hypothetical protein